MRFRGVDIRRLNYNTRRGQPEGSLVETLSDSALVYTRDCPDTIFYQDNTKTFAPNEKAYVTYKGHKLYQIQDASEQLIDHNVDGSHDEWTSQRIDFDSNINPQKWSPSTDNDTHYNTYPISFDGSSYYTWSALVKASEYNQIRLTLDGTYFDGTPVAEFDLSDGSVDTETDCVASVIPAGNGRYYVSISGLSDGAGAGTVGLYILSSGSDTFAGNGSDGIYFYGAKCEQSAFPTSFHRGGVNLFEYSQAFEESGSWTANNCTPNDNVIANPVDGEITACLLQENSDNNKHYPEQTVFVDGSSDYCLSVYLKAKERYKARVWADTACFVASFYIDINLSTGVITNATGTSTYGIEDCGNGWYRCWMVGTSDAAGSNDFRIYICDDDGNNIYQGDGSSGLYVFGDQLEINDEPSPYEYTTDSANSGIRVKTQAYWDAADVKQWTWQNKHKIIVVPFASSDDVRDDWTIYMHYDSSTTARVALTVESGDQVRIAWNDGVGSSDNVQISGLSWDRYEPATIILDPVNGTIEVDGWGNGSESLDPWNSLDLDDAKLYLGVYYTFAIQYFYGFISSPIRM